MLWSSVLGLWVLLWSHPILIYHLLFPLDYLRTQFQILPLYTISDAHPRALTLFKTSF